MRCSTEVKQDLAEVSLILCVRGNRAGGSSSSSTRGAVVALGLKAHFVAIFFFRCGRLEGHHTGCVIYEAAGLQKRFNVEGSVGCAYLRGWVCPLCTWFHGLGQKLQSKTKLEPIVEQRRWALMPRRGRAPAEVGGRRRSLSGSHRAPLSRERLRSHGPVAVSRFRAGESRAPRLQWERRGRQKRVLVHSEEMQEFERGESQ